MTIDFFQIAKLIAEIYELISLDTKQNDLYNLLNALDKKIDKLEITLNERLRK